MPSALRAALIIAAIAAFDVAFVRVFAWHDYAWMPIGIGVALAILYGCFEIKRYRPNVDRSASSWRATGEVFIDPTSGEKTTVYYDAASGKRDYRTSVF